MQQTEERQRGREAARQFEAALLDEQRKLLGQFFTGLPLGRLLAHLALHSGTATVLDPMAGHGDLLDAVWETSIEQNIAISRLDGIEIDEPTAVACRERLRQVVGTKTCPEQRIVCGSAFDPGVVGQLIGGGYDLVITNPPFVRYQVRKVRNGDDESVRAGLESIANGYLTGFEKEIWRALIKSYSGLADLSIPSWLLAALLVRPGGRLALVVPATWQSRNYADVVRYLLLRCFSPECIVEDSQPGWFNKALVRTHLIVAKRLPIEDAQKPLITRKEFPAPSWIQIEPEAGASESIVGGAFVGDRPEEDFIGWLRTDSAEPPRGIRRLNFDSRQEWNSLESRISTKDWYSRLEHTEGELRFYAQVAQPRQPTLSVAVRDVLQQDSSSLCLLEDVGIHVGQGLRTGCNQFFYVTELYSDGNGVVRVITSESLGGQEFAVPEGALRPVVRRQSEVPCLQTGEAPPGRVLDLRGWVLPEDWGAVTDNLGAYHVAGAVVPQIMPSGLANLVRVAANAKPKGTTPDKRIPELSAVRTNVRRPQKNSPPRFWYMLPDFSDRHLPAAFVARVNHNLPWAEANLEPPIVVDANFTSVWPGKGNWTRFGLKAILNSIWCRTLMEAIGTPLGGGALKVEASHLRNMPVPRLSDYAIERLNTLGSELTQGSSEVQKDVDCIVIEGVLGPDTKRRQLINLGDKLGTRAHQLRRNRQKVGQ